MKVIKFFQDGSFVISELPFIPDGYYPVPKNIEKYKFFTLVDGKVIVDLQKEKKDTLLKLNSRAKLYILNTLKSQDWGETYEEALSELQNTAIATETKILYFLKPKLPNLTLTQIRENIALYLAKQKTADQITDELTQAGLTEEEINQYFDLLKLTIEVAKLINWIEQVWEYVEKVETQIESAQDIKELENIINNVSFPSIE